MGKKIYDWKKMTDREKKFYKKKYMRDYYASKRTIISNNQQNKGEKLGFTRKRGNFVVEFQ
tara:strand:- start:87 stop:269 length:183 start_codon:yes stop_codon:yes gene_type:complete